MADGGVWTKIYPDVASLGGGKVLQVVDEVCSETIRTNSTNYVTTKLSASITPSSASNKIVVFATVPISKVDDGIFSGAYIALFNGLLSDPFLQETEIFNEKNTTLSLPLSFVDYPSTTSVVTYTVGIKTVSDLIYAESCPVSRVASIILLEVAP